MYRVLRLTAAVQSDEVPHHLSTSPSPRSAGEPSSPPGSVLPLVAVGQLAQDRRSPAESELSPARASTDLTTRCSDLDVVYCRSRCRGRSRGGVPPGVGGVVLGGRGRGYRRGAYIYRRSASRWGGNASECAHLPHSSHDLVRCAVPGLRRGTRPLDCNHLDLLASLSAAPHR